MLRDAERRWSGCRPAGEASSPPQVLELIVLGPAHGLALIRTDCHSDAEGAHNPLGSVVHVRRGRVALPRRCAL